MDAATMPPVVRIKTLEPVLAAGRIVDTGETVDVSPVMAARLVDMRAAVRVDGQSPVPFVNSPRNKPPRLSDLIY